MSGDRPTTGRPAAEAQLRRVLALIPWLAAHRNAPKADVAARFGISVEQLDHDLDLVMMIGVPPYTPGDYVNVEYEGDVVDLFLAPHFTRPLHLSAPEGVALLAAGRALLGVPGSDPAGPLATALGKLERALGHEGGIGVSLDAPPHLGAVQEAAARGERLAVEYWTAGRDAVTEREIDPGPPFFALGAWYTDAYCHLRAEPRMFRIDRIQALRPTGARFTPVPPDPRETVYDPRPDDPRVTIELPPAAAWVAESTTPEAVEDTPDGGVIVTLAVSELAWLERTLARAGPGARVLEPSEWVDVGPRAAMRILTRYRAGDGA